MKMRLIFLIGVFLFPFSVYAIGSCVAIPMDYKVIKNRSKYINSFGLVRGHHSQSP